MPNLLNAGHYFKGELFQFDKHIHYELIKSDLQVPEGCFLELGKYEAKEFYRLRDWETETTQALLITTNVSFHNKLYKELTNIEVAISGQGFGKFLYKTAIIQSEHPLISDKVQTLPGSVNVWKKLKFEWRQRRFTIGYIDLSASRIQTWDRSTNEHLIWGIPAQILHDLEEFEDTEVLEDMLEYGDITKEHFDFMVTHKHNLKDRSHIRLYVERK